MKRMISVLILLGLACWTGCESKKPASTDAPAPAATETTDETAVSQIVDLTPETFDAFIQSEEKVLVDFWAPWCPPCRKQGELIHEWEQAGKLPPAARIGKVNVDECEALANRFNVNGIPALFIFRKGEIVQSFMGLQDEETLLNALK